MRREWFHSEFCRQRKRLPDKGFGFVRIGCIVAQAKHSQQSEYPGLVAPLPMFTGELKRVVRKSTGLV